tara:strand:- start:16 stop:1563 length:1548 start_codon:yes stop_codon:yes gene_type:complete
MHDFIIIGSGLASISAAKKIIKSGFKPLILDVSNELEKKKLELKNKLKNTYPLNWHHKDIERLNYNPTIKHKIPKKLFMGSDFFYGTSSFDKEIDYRSKIKPAFSYAFGGLANGWGSAILPLDKNNLKNYPIAVDKMYKSYEEVLNDLPYSAVDDQLSHAFPILKNPESSIKLNKNLENLKNNLSKEFNTEEVIYGNGRFLCDSRNKHGCKYCGNCMSGCVYDYIYKPESDWNKLIDSKKVEFVKKAKMLTYEDNNDYVIVKFLDKNGKIQTIKTKKLLIGAGALPSTKIFMSSKKIFNKKINLRTKNGFVLPIFLKKKDKSNWLNSNTLAGLFVEFQKNGKYFHSQISSPNELVLKKISLGILPLKLVAKFAFNSFLLCHGNLSSEESDHYSLELKNYNGKEILEVEHKNSLNKKIFNEVLNKYSEIFSKMNYLPLKFLSRITDSQHSGGSLPMSDKIDKFNNTNHLGLVNGDKNTHFIDGSILPYLPAYPIALTIMANSNYISQEAVKSVKRI